MKFDFSSNDEDGNNALNKLDTMDGMHLLVLLTFFDSRVSFDENKAMLENSKGKE